MSEIKLTPLQTLVFKANQRNKLKRVQQELNEILDDMQIQLEQESKQSALLVLAERKNLEQVSGTILTDRTI